MHQPRLGLPAVATSGRTRTLLRKYTYKRIGSASSHSSSISKLRALTKSIRSIPPFCGRAVNTDNAAIWTRHHCTRSHLMVSSMRSRNLCCIYSRFCVTTTPSVCISRLASKTRFRQGRARSWSTSLRRGHLLPSGRRPLFPEPSDRRIHTPSWATQLLLISRDSIEQKSQSREAVSKQVSHLQAAERPSLAELPPPLPTCHASNGEPPAYQPPTNRQESYTHANYRTTRGSSFAYKQVYKLPRAVLRTQPPAAFFHTYTDKRVEAPSPPKMIPPADAASPRSARQKPPLRMNDLFNVLDEIDASAPLSSHSRKTRQSPSSAYSPESYIESDFVEDEVESDELKVTYLSKSSFPYELVKEAQPHQLWTHSLYRNSKGEQPRVVYCDSFAKAEEYAQLLVDKDILGLDLEWRAYPSGRTAKDNVSLIQMASDDCIVLFHVALFEGSDVEELMPPTLRKILESPDIVKTGVWINGDGTRLKTYLNVNVSGLLELSHLHNLVTYAPTSPSKVSKKLVKLSDLMEHHIGFKMNKDQDVRASDWSKPLNDAQVLYAASDAYAGPVLFDILERKRHAIKPTPPRPYFAELRLPIRLSEDDEPAYALSSDAVVETVELDAVRLESLASPRPAKDSRVTASGLSAALSKSFGPGPPSPSPPPKAASAPPTAPSAELALATAWADSFRSAASNSGGNTKYAASRNQLLAYALWHQQGMSVPAVARALKSPPLKTSTVSLYVLQAIVCERLPWDKDRLKPVFGYAGRHGDAWRFAQLRRECGKDEPKAR